MLGPKGLGQAEMAVSISTKGGSDGDDGAGDGTAGAGDGGSGVGDKTMGGALKNFGRAAFGLVKDITSSSPDAASCGE